MENDEAINDVKNNIHLIIAPHAGKNWDFQFIWIVEL